MQQHHHHHLQPYPQTVQEDMVNYYRNYYQNYNRIYSFYQPDQTLFSLVQPSYGFPVYPQTVYGFPNFALPSPRPYYNLPMQPMSNDNYINRPQTLEWPHWVHEYGGQRQNYQLQESDQQGNLPLQFDYESEDDTDSLYLADVFDYFMSTGMSADDALEALQEWFEDVETNNDSNLSEETISQHLKTRKYQTDLANQEPEICVVCQCEYENEETIGTLECQHGYHADCIQRWLLEKIVCPLCKRPAIQQEA